jgi:glycosyltransferase involved in cell wall biosynthesis
MISLSLVIPVCDERESIPTLGAELLDAVTKLPFARESVEIVLVDDGSRDGTWEAIVDLAGVDRRVRGIRLRRNFGKAAALTAGFEAARGEVLFTLDGDGQDDPAELPRFLARLSEGLDVVSGWKRVRHDPWHKVWPSRLFNWCVSRLTGCVLHDHNCGFKVYRRAVVDEVGIYGELHRFIPVLAHARGFRVGELEVNHRVRRFGRSKYGFARLIKGFLDLLTVRFLTRFSQRPLHVLGTVALVAMLAGAVGMVYLLVEWLVGHRPIGNRPLLVYSATLLGLGTQLFSLGILAELITAYLVRPRDSYSIAETTRVEADHADSEHSHGIDR